MKKQLNIFRLNGQGLGFVDDGNLFSWQGEYLGWVEGGLVWDKEGHFRGSLAEINGYNYILRNLYIVSPIPRISRIAPPPPSLPSPQLPIRPIQPPIGFKDAF